MLAGCGSSFSSVDAADAQTQISDAATPDAADASAADVLSEVSPGQDAIAEDAPPQPPPASCAEILQRDPKTNGKSGIYVVRPSGGATGPVNVFCDMVADGGGWTLVARTGTSDPGGWGWKKATGSLDDDDLPYSLDLAAHPIPFAQILVGSVIAGSKEWADNAYRFDIPNKFVETFATTSWGLGAPFAVIGTCKPATTGGFMLARVGYTDSPDVFYFRDTDGLSNFGLMSVGWNLADPGSWGECQRNGMLSGQPGMLMIR
jgi:hypothetical protein